MDRWTTASIQEMRQLEDEVAKVQRSISQIKAWRRKSEEEREFIKRRVFDKR